MSATEIGTIQSIIDRAASDPDFLSRLAQDPAAAIQAEGLQVSPQDLKNLLNMPNASDKEAVEALQARLSHSGGLMSLNQTSP